MNTLRIPPGWAWQILIRILSICNKNEWSCLKKVQTLRQKSYFSSQHFKSWRTLNLSQNFKNLWLLCKKKLCHDKYKKDYRRNFTKDSDKIRLAFRVGLFLFARLSREGDPIVKMSSANSGEWLFGVLLLKVLFSPFSSSVMSFGSTLAHNSSSRPSLTYFVRAE